MTENKRYVRILDYSEKEVRIFDENNQKNIFNIFFEGLDSAICLKGALEDTVDLLNYFNDEKKELKKENEQLKRLLQNTSDQRDEFHRGARENANRVGKLKKENEQLKARIKHLERKIQRERASTMKQHEKWEKEIQKENEQLKEENQQYKVLLQDMGLLISDGGVMCIRDEIAEKFIKPLFKENGFDVDVDCTNGFTIILKGDE